MEDVLREPSQRTSCYFNCALPPAEADFPIKIGDYTRTEVEAAIQSLKNSKAPGIDSAMCAETN